MHLRLPIVAAFACLACLAWAASALAAPVRWSSPTQLPNGVFSISCPSMHLCVAGTDVGVIVSTDPGGGAGAWVQSVVPPARTGFGNAVHGVACASTSFCVAVGTGSILTSTDPAGGASAWKVARVSLPSDEYLAGLACGSRSLCVAFAASTRLTPSDVAPRNGRVLSSTNPAGGAGAWKDVVLHDVPDYVYCLPSTCLLATEDGDILSSRHPTSGAGAWRSVHEFGTPGGPAYLPVVACASTHYCLAPIGGITHRGELLTRDLSNAKRFGWAYLQGFGGANYPAPSGGSCVASGFCAFGATLGNEGSSSSHGELVTSSGPRKPWATTNIKANAGVAVSCVSQTFCVAGGAEQPSNGGFLSGVIVVGHG